MGDTLQINDDHYVAQNQLAEGYIETGDLPKAADVLVRIIDADPDNYRAYNNLGLVAWEKEDWDDAFRLFRKALTIRADYNDALVNLFDAAVKLRSVQETLPWFDKALAIDWNLDEVRLMRDSINELGDSIYLSERALQVGIWSPLCDKGAAEIKAGNYFKAMELFLEANDKEGPSAQAFTGLGIVSYYQGNFDDAYRLFVQSLKYNPMNVDTLLNLLDAAKAINQVDNARAVFEECLRNYPSLESIASAFDLKPA